jgi:sialate O-acetylesterase
MILQRERAAAIWGKADANAEVTLSFKGKSATAKAGADGKWRAQIETGAADANGAVLTISAGADKIEIKDVLVGEVWFASGQSNMFYTMNRSPEYAGLIKESNHPALRMFNAPLVTAAENQDDIEGVVEGGHAGDGAGVIRRWRSSLRGSCIWSWACPSA